MHLISDTDSSKRVNTMNRLHVSTGIYYKSYLTYTIALGYENEAWVQYLFEKLSAILVLVLVIDGNTNVKLLQCQSCVHLMLILIEKKNKLLQSFYLNCNALINKVV